MDYEINKIFYVLLSLCINKSVKVKSVFEKYLSNKPKYASQIQILIFHLVGFQIQIQIFAYLNTNTNTNTYLTPALLKVSNNGDATVYHSATTERLDNGNNPVCR